MASDKLALFSFFHPATFVTASFHARIAGFGRHKFVVFEKRVDGTVFGSSRFGLFYFGALLVRDWIFFIVGHKDEGFVSAQLLRADLFVAQS